MDKIHIEKGSVKETLIIPLYARRLCAEQFPTLYRDEYAAKIYESIDYDFSQFKSKEKSAMYQFGALEGAMREKDMLWEKFADVHELNKKLKTHLSWSNNKAMRSLAWQSPLERLTAFLRSYH